MTWCYRACLGREKPYRKELMNALMILNIFQFHHTIIIIITIINIIGYNIC